MFWLILLIVARTYWCLRNNFIYQRIAFWATIAIFTTGTALALVTRQADIFSWIFFGLMLLPWILQFLFSPGRRIPILHMISLGWIALAVAALIVTISNQSLLSLHNARTPPLISVFFIWIISGVLLFLTPPKSWPATFKSWGIPLVFIMGVQLLAVLSVLALSQHISMRAQVIGGENACIIDPTGRSFQHSYWISPGRMLQNNYRYMTLPWLLLETNGEPTHHWSFRNMDFMSNDGHWAFDIPSARRNAALSGLQIPPCGSQETTQRLP